MKQSKNQIWRRSMLKTLNYDDITEYLDEIGNNGDPYGYESEESGYYQEYKDQFDDLSEAAYRLYDALENLEKRNYYSTDTSLRDIWDDMTVALIGYQEQVLGFDVVEEDYYAMISCYEDAAVEAAEERIMRLTKKQLIANFRRVFTTLILFFDIKAAHDCLTSIVEELDERGAMLKLKSKSIDKLYEDLTGANAEEFDNIIKNIPPRMWVE